MKGHDMADRRRRAEESDARTLGHVAGAAYRAAELSESGGDCLVLSERVGRYTVTLRDGRVFRGASIHGFGGPTLPGDAPTIRARLARGCELLINTVWTYASWHSVRVSAGDVLSIAEVRPGAPLNTNQTYTMIVEAPVPRCCAREGRS